MTDVTNRIACPGTDAGQKDLVPLYLAGKLTESEAEAFEAHYLGCPKCREDVRAGAALRELYGRPAVAAAGVPRPPRRTWLPLAAAAAIAFVAVGVWQWSRRAEDSGSATVRGTNAPSLVVKIANTPERDTAVSWTPLPDATTYQVQVFGSDGARVSTTDVNEPQLSFRAGVLPTPVPGQFLAVEVRALDALGRVAATSEPTRLESPR